MLVDSAHYVFGKRQCSTPLTIAEAAACPRTGSSFVWLSLHEPEPELMGEVQQRFGLHELAVEDAQRAHNRPKLEQYDDFHYIVLRTAAYDEQREEVEFGELHLFVAPGFVISVRHGDSPGAVRARKRLEGRAQLLKSGPAAVVWGILDEVVDDYQPVVDGLESDIEEVERLVFARHDDQTERIYGLKQAVREFYRAVHPLLAPLDALERGSAFAEIDPGLKRYFRDVNDHLKHVNDDALAQRDQLGSVLDANVALINVRQNEISARQNALVTQLTVIATVFLPLTFVTGFFGQNFLWLTGHIDSLGAFLVLGLGGLVVPCAALYVWFRRGSHTQLPDPS